MLCGIDESGRGCVAGPLVVAGVVLNQEIEGLADSKVLSEAKRDTLFAIIKESAEYKIVFCDNKMVDDKGLSYCLGYAIKNIKEYFLSKEGEYEILMDGNSTFGVSGIQTMIKADAKVPEVSAASILAKVSRDQFMYSICDQYPHYAFSKHKGYGTALHIEEIKNYGYSDIHRTSFKIKSLREPSLF